MRLWGSTIDVDHVSKFMYNHLIEGTISADTLIAKHGYERGYVLWSQNKDILC